LYLDETNFLSFYYPFLNNHYLLIQLPFPKFGVNVVVVAVVNTIPLESVYSE